MTDQEINEAVARKLGYELVKPNWWQFPKETGRGPVPDYCHSIEAAWEILLKVEYWSIRTMKGREDEVLVELGFGPLVGCWADTAPRAICLAFLKLP